MKQTHISLMLLLLFSLVFNDIALSWDDRITHKDLSEYAGELSMLDQDSGDYLRRLSFIEGLEAEFKWRETKQSVRRWLREGVELEDSSGPFQIGYLNGRGRSFNHFHNALKRVPWSDAGLDDWIPMPPFHVEGRSSILWAQDGTYQENFYEGNWSWQKTRDYFLAALTATTRTDREEDFAKTFKGLGHQMHLLQDTAVPDHVRNDAHPEDAIFGKDRRFGSYYFETWTKTTS